jgi:hypothetical protein
MTNKAWCPLPWMSVNVRNNGDLRVCCNANVGHDKGLVRKEDGTLYNLGKDGVHSFRNGELMKEIRLAMLKGEFHPSCVRCQREHEAGMVSRADNERSIWKHVINEDIATDRTAEDGSIVIEENPLKYTDLRFGNFCNLKCRMCGPTDSNQWYDDQARVWDVKSYKDSGEVVKLVLNKKGKYEAETDIYNWYENPKFWSDLEEQIPSLERLYIVGGEPLLIDQHYEFLQKCIDMGRAKNIIVEYNSNITNIPERAWNIWKNFKRIQVGMSVDAVGKINDYIRNPSKFWKIAENMHKLDKAEGDFKIWWAATILIYNMIHLPDIMHWKIKQNFQRVNKRIDYKPVISPHPLHSPDFLNVKAFPKESKEWISNYFEEEKVKAKGIIFGHGFLEEKDKEINYKYFCKILDQYVKYMNAEDYSDRVEKFWHYTNRLDGLRKENLKEVCPKTWELMLGEKYANPNTGNSN